MKIKSIAYFSVLSLSIILNLAFIFVTGRVNQYRWEVEQKEKESISLVEVCEGEKQFLFELVSLKITNFNLDELFGTIKNSGVEASVGGVGKNNVKLVIASKLVFEYEDYQTGKEHVLGIHQIK